MTSILRRTLAAVATATTAGALLLAGGAPASANHDAIGHDQGLLKSVVDGATKLTYGTNFSYIGFSPTGPCSDNTTKHQLQITEVVADASADQAAADKWEGQNFYSPIDLDLPYVEYYEAADTWQAMANNFSTSIVPGTYNFQFKCWANNFGSLLNETWTGSVIFTSPTAWEAGPVAEVGVPTTTTVSASPNPATTAQTVTLTATVAEDDAAAPTGDVEFKNGDTVLGTAAVDASGVATLTVGPLSAGTHPITAAYAGDGAFAGSISDPVTVTVEQAPAAATATTLVVDPASGPAYQNVTLTGTVANTDDPAVVPTGTCEFLDGAATVGSAPVDSSGVCAMTSAAFAAGDHAFQAVYTPSDPALFTGSESAVVPATYDAGITAPDEQAIVVTVPAGELTIVTPYTPDNPLNLGDMVLAGDGSSFSATAPFDKVTVTDTRAGNPGWAASLIRADFVGATGTIPAQYSGFENVTPNYITGNAIQSIEVMDVAAGSAPSGPEEFASAAAGQGTGTVDIVADFVLEGVPTSTPAGLYTTTVTFTVS